jgi:hypothetical protein
MVSFYGPFPLLTTAKLFVAAAIFVKKLTTD